MKQYKIITATLHNWYVHNFFYCTQLFAQLVSCDWQEVTLQTKAEWRSAQTICGVLCVMIPGIALMLLWCVNNLDIPQMVRRVIDLTNMYIASFWKFTTQH